MDRRERMRARVCVCGMKTTLAKAGDLVRSCVLYVEAENEKGKVKNEKKDRLTEKLNARACLSSSFPER